jgi:hypothetical protein
VANLPFSSCSLDFITVVKAKYLSTKYLSKIIAYILSGSILVLSFKNLSFLTLLLNTISSIIRRVSLDNNYTRLLGNPTL